MQGVEGTFLTAFPSWEEEKRRRCAQELLPRFPAFPKDPHSVIINSPPWQHIVFQSRQSFGCDLPTVCFLHRRVYASPSGETKGTKTPLARARAYVPTRRTQAHRHAFQTEPGWRRPRAGLGTPTWKMRPARRSVPARARLPRVSEGIHKRVTLMQLRRRSSLASSDRIRIGVCREAH